MKRITNLMALLVGPLMMGAWACSTRVEAPPRPGGVPKSAVWAGGADGGAWIECTPTGERFRCVVYHDVTGGVEARGEYRLLPSGGDRSLTYSGFDGDTIFLSGNRKLVQVRARRSQ